MKRFSLKKIAMMSLAAMMAVSAISMTAFAEETVAMTLLSSYVNDLNDTLPEIGSTVTFTDADGIEQQATVAGYLDINEVSANEPMPMWDSNWMEDVEIPRNIDGHQGAQIGLWYSPKTTENYAKLSTRNWNAHLNTLNVSLTEKYLTSSGYKYNIYVGAIESPSTYTITGVRLTAGRSYAYTFSSQQNSNSQAECDLRLFSE
ncbi:MAG: hypothetical protein Q4G33_14480 [bacterium]|nr:hypothetical protein [bacterium]